jgi:hypothetical protein
MNTLLPPADKRWGESRQEGKKDQPSAIDLTTHDMINQLSVISLCCCALRASMAEKLEANQLAEFERIERAVQVTAETIRKLKGILQDHGPPLDKIGIGPKSKTRETTSNPICLA